MVVPSQSAPYPADMIQADQIKAARALLGWGQADLAKAAGVSVVSVKRIEAGSHAANSATLEAIEAALDKAGVAILESGAASLQGGRGVRLKRR